MRSLSYMCVCVCVCVCVCINVNINVIYIYNTDSLLFMNCNKRFRMHGPKVSRSNSISKGPIRVEIRVVNQGDRLNHPSNQFCWAPYLFAIGLACLSTLP